MFSKALVNFQIESSIDMATFGWSYTKNFSGSKRPHLESRKVQEWQTNRAVTVRRQALHPQSHSAETVTAGKKFRCELNFQTPFYR